MTNIKLNSKKYDLKHYEGGLNASLNNELLINPKLITFLNSMDHHDFAISLVRTINHTAKAVDTSLTKHKQGLEPPKGTKLVVYIDKPKRTLAMKTNDNGVKLRLAKINGLYPDNSFKESPDYKDLMTMANSGHDKSLPLDKQFNKVTICRDELNIKVGLVESNEGHHLIKGTFDRLGIVQHYTFTFSSGRYTCKIPIDLPLIIHW